MSLSNSKSRGTNSSRRRFLHSVLTGFAGLAALVTTDRTNAAPVDVPESSQNLRTTGYQETDHVRKYYDTARM